MTDDDRKLLDYLQSFLTARRRQRLETVLAQRTRWISVVLEDLYDAHNIGAIARSCDAFGLQDLHVIEVTHEYQPEPEVALGSQQWLTVHRHGRGEDPRAACISALRAQGYRIVVATPAPDGCPPGEVDLSRPVAVVFGTEKDGATAGMLADADARLTIPMFGFVQSLNVSVAAAICLQQLSARLRKSEMEWRLSETERETLRMDWTRQSVPNVEQIERRYREAAVSAADEAEP